MNRSQLQNKSSTKDSLAGIVTALVVVVVLAVVGLMYVSNSIPKNTNASPENNSSTKPPDNAVIGTSGKTWRYEINPDTAQKYQIAVTSGQPGTDAELSINATGCNGMSAEITSAKSEVSSSRTIQAGGAIYYLSGPISTLMACMGEKADWDEKAQSAIFDIFESLRLDH